MFYGLALVQIGLTFGCGVIFYGWFILVCPAVQFVGCVVQLWFVLLCVLVQLWRSFVSVGCRLMFSG